ncbi:putative Receptor-like protein kinase-related family protein [Hibiscus syriacus]|uniref:Receptor-like protein kinase-related family protein n=1 Tax=Hibiscus syriacus TaxID=106335 RepID=A0A6A3A6K4_HIBSY|nr:putative Receptor-like protein kinase-related family protein [Hibiscus syriacus]
MESQEPNVIKSTLMYSNRVPVKTVLEGSDAETGFVGTIVVVGGWVKVSKEVQKELMPPPPPSSPPMAGPQLFEKTSSKFTLRVSQVVIDSATVPVSAGQILPTGTCVSVQGVLEKPLAHGKQTIELKVEKILHVGTVEQDKYPLSRKRLPLDSLRDYPHIRPRTTTVTTILGEISKEASIGVSDADGVSLETIKAAVKEKSILVEELKRSDSNREALAAALQGLRKTNKLAQQVETTEKSKAVTAVKPDLVSFNVDFFGRQSYLTVSGHLHLESYARALGHLNHLNCSHIDHIDIFDWSFRDAMKCAEDYFKFLCRWISDNCWEDMMFIWKRIDKTVVHRLEYMASSSYDKIPYREAVEILRKVTDKAFEIQLQWGVPLTDEHLSAVLTMSIHSVTATWLMNTIGGLLRAASVGDLRIMKCPPCDDGKIVAAFEMVVPKIGTVATGSQNEERFDILNTRYNAVPAMFHRHNYFLIDARQFLIVCNGFLNTGSRNSNLSKYQYEWYLDLRRHGTVEHSGFSLGFDLMVLLAAGLTDVRDVIPFIRSHRKAIN